MISPFRLLTTIVTIAIPFVTTTANDSDFKVGFAQKDITPQVSTPMWGYGARKDMLSQGTLDPLMAKAFVIEAGADRVALVGLDLGRAPTTAMMDRIRTLICERAKIGHVLLVASHMHHGPVLELTDREDKGVRTRFADLLGSKSLVHP